MKFLQELQHILETPGRVHTIKNPNVKPRGAPEEPARAFDKPGTDRSVLAKLENKNGEFHVIEGELEWLDFSDDANDELINPGTVNQIQIHVVSANSDKIKDYRGINVILQLKKTKLELDPDYQADLIGFDSVSKVQIKKWEHNIVKACLDAIKNDDIPGIYDGMGGKSHKVPKIGGVDEWAKANLSELKNKTDD